MFQFIAKGATSTLSSQRIAYSVGRSASSTFAIVEFDNGSRETRSTIAWTEIALGLTQRVPIDVIGANAAEYVNISVPGSIIYEIAGYYTSVTTITGETTVNIYTLNI